jgi:hypothetical protein
MLSGLLDRSTKKKGTLGVQSGQTYCGLQRSRIVMYCSQVAVFPHKSVTRYFRESSAGQLMPLNEKPLTVSVLRCVTVATPQLSDQPTEFGLGAGTLFGQLTVMLRGHMIVGGVTSLIVMICVSLATLPQPSVYTHILVRISGQEPPLLMSVPLTMPEPSQLSVHASWVIA